MQTWDFDAAVNEMAGNRQTFRLAGQEYTLRAKLPFTKWNKLLEKMNSDEVDNLSSTLEFYDLVLIRADRQRFHDALTADDADDDDEAGVIGVEQMRDLTDKVMEHFTGKLQSSTDGSSPGADTTGASPNVVSLNARTTAS